MDQLGWLSYAARSLAELDLHEPDAIARRLMEDGCASWREHPLSLWLSRRHPLPATEVEWLCYWTEQTGAVIACRRRRWDDNGRLTDERQYFLAVPAHVAEFLRRLDRGEYAPLVRRDQELEPAM